MPEKEPSRRYQTARELADELGRFLRDNPSTRPVSRFGTPGVFRRKPTLASLCAALVLVFTPFHRHPVAWRNAAHNAQAEIKQRQFAEGMASAPRRIATRCRSLYESDMNLAQHSGTTATSVSHEFAQKRINAAKRIDGASSGFISGTFVKAING